MKEENAVSLLEKIDPVYDNNSESGSGSVHWTPLIKASQVNTAPPPPHPTRIKLCSRAAQIMSCDARKHPTASLPQPAALMCVCVNGEVLILTGTGPISGAANRRELVELACLLNQNRGMKTNRELIELSSGFVQ